MWLCNYWDLRSCCVAGIRLRATQQVGADMNSTILYMQNAQDGHIKERDTGGRDVDGRAHRAYIKGFKPAKKYVKEARGGEVFVPPNAIYRCTQWVWESS